MPGRCIAKLAVQPSTLRKVLFLIQPFYALSATATRRLAQAHAVYAALHSVKPPKLWLIERLFRISNRKSIRKRRRSNRPTPSEQVSNHPNTLPHTHLGTVPVQRRWC